MLIDNLTIRHLIIVFILSAGIARAQTSTPELRAAPRGADPVVLYADRMLPHGAESAQQVLDRIQKSITDNEPAKLRQFFASKVYISLLSGKEGYFSAEQSYFIIKRFFLTYTPVAFTFSNTTAQTDSPYGVGTLQYMNRSKPGKAQVFVSLTHAKDNWRISQITITNR